MILLSLLVLNNYEQTNGLIDKQCVPSTTRQTHLSEAKTLEDLESVWRCQESGGMEWRG